MRASLRVTRTKIYVSAYTMPGRKLGTKYVMHCGVNADRTTREIFLRSRGRAS